MTKQQALWVLAAKQIDADPESHEDDENIQPIYDRLKELYINWKTQYGQ
jgi:hypothetical protein